MLPGPVGVFAFAGEEKWRGVKFLGGSWLSEKFRELESLWESDEFDEFREGEPKDEKKLDLNLGSPQ